ncbi:hypothetical protein LXL04_037380 [Taraxacum kok-saghyz]
MMAIRPFLVIFFGFLICTIEITRGRHLVGNENISPPHAHDKGTRKIGCSNGDKTCGKEHVYNIKESLKEYIRGLFAGDNGKRTEKLHRQIRNNLNKSHVKKSGCRDMENNGTVYCIVDCKFTYNSNNKNSDKGSNNVIGNGSGGGNGGVKGDVNENGNNTTNGSGSSNSVTVKIGASPPI